MRVTPVLFVTFLAVPAPFASAQQTSTPPQTAGATSAQGVEANKDNTPPPMKPAPKLSESEMDLFLRTAEIKERKKLTVGTTAAEKLTLSDDKLTHDAQFQPIDVYKPVFHGAEGTEEKNFRDTWKFNVAAYRLAAMLGIDNVPMSVEREVDGKLGSMTWWIDNVWISEADRRDRGIKPPPSQFWVDQLNVVRVFDQLIYNTDRNQGNLLITPEWRIWMIDHTRAFRTAPTLLTKNPLPGRVDHKLLNNIRALNALQLKEKLGGYLRPEEIAAIMARRDLIIAHFDREIKQRGEDAVLTGIPRKTPEVSLP